MLSRLLPPAQSHRGPADQSSRSALVTGGNNVRGTVFNKADTLTLINGTPTAGPVSVADSTAIASLP
jgi:hypothetical protein